MTNENTLDNMLTSLLSEEVLDDNEVFHTNYLIGLTRDVSEDNRQIVKAMQIAYDVAKKHRQEVITKRPELSLIRSQERLDQLLSTIEALKNGDEAIYNTFISSLSKRH